MKTKLLIVGIFVFVSFSACSPRAGQEVNVYSGRHYQSDEVLFAEFTEETGIRVNLIKADSDQLITRMELEGADSPADLLITVDAGRLILAGDKGLLQPFESDFVEAVVPGALRDANKTWTGLTKRARVLVYHKERVNPAELSSYEDLSLPQWKGRILFRSAQNQYNQTLMASMVAAHGSQEAERWARAIVANMARPPQGNDRDQVKAIAAGAGDVAIVNTYYMGLLLHSTDEAERKVADQVGIFFPNQADRGTHINISGVGLAVHAPNKKNAVRLIEFLLSDHAQQFLAESTYEYPVSSRVGWPQLLTQWGSFKADTIQLSNLKGHLQEAMFVFNRAGWQ